MTDPELGRTPEGDAVRIDIGRLVGAHFGIVAQAGAGKSHAIRKMLEATHGSVQHIVLDSEDEFYTLRERFEYVVAGGDGGDFPVTVASAAQVATALLENGLSAVVQMNALGRSGAREFVARFLEAVIAAPQQLWHPTLVVLDEADRFVPNGERTTSSDAVVEYVSKGRKRGFGIALATQRLSKISRDATGDTHNWLFGRVGQGTDRRRVADELGFSPTGAEARGLMALDSGQFWVRGPALASVPTLIQVGAVETSHIRAGESRVPTPPAAGRLKEIVAALAAAAAPPPEPEKPADAAPSRADHAASVGSSAPRVEIRDASAEQIAAAERRGEQVGFERGLEQGGNLARDFTLRVLREARGVLDRAIGEQEQLQRVPDQHAVTPTLSSTASSQTASKPAREKPPTVAAHARPTGNDGIRQKILDSLAELAALTPVPPTREVAIYVSGYSPNTNAVKAALARMREEGLIEVPEPGHLALSDQGRALAKAPEGALTTQEVVSRISSALGPIVGRVLDVLVDAWPSYLSREALAERSGYSTNTNAFKAAIPRLKELGLATLPGAGQVRAADLLFPETRS